MKITKRVEATETIELQLPAYFAKGNTITEVSGEESTTRISLYDDGTFHVTFGNLKCYVNDAVNETQVSKSEWIDAMIEVKKRANKMLLDHLPETDTEYEN